MSVPNMEEIQRVMDSSTLRDDAKLMQPPPGTGGPPMPPSGPPMPPQGTDMPPMMPPQDAQLPPMPLAPPLKETLNTILTNPKANGKSLQE